MIAIALAAIVAMICLWLENGAILLKWKILRESVPDKTQGTYERYSLITRRKRKSLNTKYLTILVSLGIIIFFNLQILNKGNTSNPDSTKRNNHSPTIIHDSITINYPAKKGNNNNRIILNDSDSILRNSKYIILQEGERKIIYLERKDSSYPSFAKVDLITIYENKATLRITLGQTEVHTVRLYDQQHSILVTEKYLLEIFVMQNNPKSLILEIKAMPR